MSIPQCFSNTKKIVDFILQFDKHLNPNVENWNSNIDNIIKDIFNFAVLKDHSINNNHKYNIWKNELYTLYICYRESKKYSGDIYSMDFPQIFKDLFKSLEMILSSTDTENHALSSKVTCHSFEVKNLTHLFSVYIFSHLLLGYSRKEYLGLLYKTSYSSMNTIKNYSYPNNCPEVFTFERSLYDLITSENVRIEFEEIKDQLFFLTAENKKLKSQLVLLESQMCKCGSIEKYDYELIKNRNKKLHKELKTMFKLFYRRSSRDNTNLECIPFAVVV